MNTLAPGVNATLLRILWGRHAGWSAHDAIREPVGRPSGLCSPLTTRRPMRLIDAALLEEAGLLSICEHTTPRQRL